MARKLMIQATIRPSGRSIRAGALLTAGLSLLLAVLLGSAPRTSVAAPKGKLVGIRSAPHGDSLRVVLDLEGSPKCLIRSSEGSSEDWEVIVEGICPSNLPPQLTPGVCLISIEPTCEGNDLRLLLRAAVPLIQSTFLMPAAGGKPGRFVIDLRPAGAAGTTATQPAPGSPASKASAPEKEAERTQTKPGAGAPAQKPLSGTKRDVAATPPPSPPPSPAEAEPAPRRTGSWRILVDPGHGGDDPGARRTGIKEKEIVLDVARRVAKALNSTPGYEARLSRDDDRRIPLRQRMLLAEKYEADAFISIHVNAAKKKNAIGVEVFFLSMGGASDEASKDLARLENEVDPDYVVDEDSLLQGIPFSFSLRQSDTLLRSSRLAESVLVSFEASGLAASRGVKQAGFAVLKSFQVPSALVEIGFLSNPAEARRLKDPKHRQHLADCIVGGTIDYFRRFARTKAGTE